MNRQLLVVNTLVELRENLKTLRKSGHKVGLVPTMGALHRGHLSLVSASKRECGVTVATIFVNPTQFAEGEDLGKYPRTLDADLELLQSAGADVVFIPEADEMYPDGFSTSIQPPDVAQKLEGEFRSTHFSGVCTIVLKLLNAAVPDVAFFGQKDYQQACVIGAMVQDLNFPAEIRVCPIVRDEDGLALSSRNRYLDDDQRKIALTLCETLRWAAEEIESGELDGHLLMAEMRQQLIDGGVDSVDYAAICHPNTLEILDTIETPAVVLLAAHVGTTRLIDNCVVE
ncbi:MAG: pantoate--beta-alanine ligase [Planctomycetota bacterium]